MASDAQVSLRAFRPDEFDLLYDRQRLWLRDEVDANPAQWRELIRERIDRSGSWDASDIDFAVEADGRLIGAVQALHDFYKLPPKAYELGIEFYEANDRGRGFGYATMRAFIPNVFANGAIRLQGRTHLENEPMIRLFERCGFLREGVLRNLWPLPGRSGDVAIYGLTADDFALRPFV